MNVGLPADRWPAAVPPWPQPECVPVHEQPFDCASAGIKLAQSRYELDGLLQRVCDLHPMAAKCPISLQDPGKWLSLLPLLQVVCCVDWCHVWHEQAQFSRNLQKAVSTGNDGVAFGQAQGILDQRHQGPSGCALTARPAMQLVQMLHGPVITRN